MIRYIESLDAKDNVKLSELGMHCDNCTIIDYCNTYEDTPPCEQLRFEDLTVFEFLGVIEYMETRSVDDEDEPLTEPKALTLEELVHKLGEPVYIYHGEWSRWGIVDHINENDVSFSGWSPYILFLHEQMGVVWFAYTHKPKE